MSKSRISVEETRQLTNKLLAKHREEIAQLQERKEQFVLEQALSIVPEKVQSLFKDYPNYIETRNSFYLRYDGRTYEWTHVGEEVPAHNDVIQIDSETNRRYEELVDAAFKAKVNYDELHDELYNVIYSLRSFKRIVKEIPEAEEFLPKDQEVKALMNLTSLRERIKK